MKTLKKLGIAILTIGCTSFISAYVLMVVIVAFYQGSGEMEDKLIDLAGFLTFAIFMPSVLIGATLISVAVYKLNKREQKTA